MVNLLAATDQHGLFQRLLIVPVEERCESVLHAIGGRQQSQFANGRRPLHNSPDALVTDHQGASWKFDEEACPSVYKMPAFGLEPQGPHHVAQFAP